MRRGRLTLLVLAFGTPAGCGTAVSPDATVSDAPPEPAPADAAPVIPDAAKAVPADAAPDAAPPDPTAAVQWERQVLVGGPQLKAVVVVAGGVVVVAEPDLVLYDDQGGEQQREAWPDPVGSEVRRAVRRADGGATLLVTSELNARWIHEHDAALAPLGAVDLGVSFPRAAAMTVAGSTTYVVVLRISPIDVPAPLDVLTVSGGAVTSTLTVAEGAPYRFGERSAVSTPAGHLLLCASLVDVALGQRRGHILRIDPSSGALTTLAIDTPGDFDDFGCELVATGGGVAALWTERDGSPAFLAGALLDAEGSEFLVAPRRVQPLDHDEYPQHFAAHGATLVGVGAVDEITQVQLFVVSASTLAKRPGYRIALPPGADYLAAVVAADGPDLYAAFEFAIDLGPTELWLQKLEPLPD